MCHKNILRCCLATVLPAVLTVCCGPISGCQDTNQLDDNPVVKQEQPDRRLEVLFLGDRGHHQPAARYKQLSPILEKRGIHLTYTDDVKKLNKQVLGRFDALLVYANIDRIEPEQATALLDYVAEGGGFVPLHCASYCFRNSQEVVALVGGQFLRHGTGTFRTEIAQPDHPLMKGFGGFESWDETYVHHLHNEQDRTVLSYRVDQQGREPWTWVRTQGKGRVFYTAWGHDQRTFGHPGFANLMERGIRWAAGSDPALAGPYRQQPGREDQHRLDQEFEIPQMTPLRKDVKPFEYLDVGAKIPNYPPSSTWGIQHEPATTMQKPLSPQESIKHFVTPVGFHVELFASEPDIGGKPICMTWDHRGRLWVAETFDYPNELQPDGRGRDRIRICEDTDGDWRADRFTVFAEDLSIPSSIAFWRDGVIVQNGTRTLYLRDTDGDDRADERRDLLTGWNMRDTHGGVSNFQYGLDNWIWAMQGYNPSQPDVAGDRVVQFSQGFFRFKPDGSQVEFLRSTDNNTWGLGISEEGIVFGSTANRNPSVYMPIPNRYYERVRGWTPSLMLRSIADTHLFKPIVEPEKVRQVDHHGGYTAAAGHAVYTARNYPRAYWNRTAFVNGPTGHLVGTFLLRRNGSDFSSSSPFNFLASDDEWSAPIMAEVGPDGNVWVIDWYNYIVQHNPTPAGFKTGKGSAYETDLRDKRYGRIYRVVYDTAAPREPVTLHGATANQLVQMLRNPTKLWRLHAQRLLVERGQLDGLPGLLALASDQSVDEIGLNVAAIHALWTMHGLGVLDGSNVQATSVAVAALKHPSAGVRMNAVKVLPRTRQSTQAIVDCQLLRDGDPHVRLATLLALSELPVVDGVGKSIVSVLQDSPTLNDRWLFDATVSAAAGHDQSFLAGLPAVQEPTDKLIEATRIVAEHFARGEETHKTPALLGLFPAANPAIVEALVEGLAGGPNETGGIAIQLTADDERQLEDLMRRISAGAQGKLLQLAQRWGSQKLAGYADDVQRSMLQDISNESRSVDQRIQSARQLIEFRRSSPQGVEELLNLLTPQTLPELAIGIVDALELSDAGEVASLILDRFRSWTPILHQHSIAVLMTRPTWTRELLTAVEQRIIPLDKISLEQKQALMSHPDPVIARTAREILRRGGVLPSADRQKAIQQYLVTTRKKGNLNSGKKLFQEHCANCHRHNGEGADVGPDLTGMAVHSKQTLLAEILDPSRSVEGNYREYKLLTIGGQMISGLLAAESKTSVELFDSKGEKHVVLREEIDELIMASKSLMPDGFEETLGQQQMSDLLEFLTHRGKYLPLDLTKVATITSTLGMFNDKSATVERLIFSDWNSKTFRGVPFRLVDPKQGKLPNIILLNGPNGAVSRRMPRQVELPVNGSLRAIHLLSGVSGWGYPYSQETSVSMIVKLHYADGQVENHPLKNAIHFADYIRREDVPESEFAFELRGQQIRYLAIRPQRIEPIEKIQFVKGEDRTAPVVMAVTVEGI